MAGEMKRVLVVAGSDPSGGAGLEADQKVIAAHGCYAMTATTALTAQNTRGVTNIHRIPTSFVEEQMEACIGDIGVDVLKTGMLASAETVEMVAKVASKHSLKPLVIDPVMVSTSGSALLPHEAIRELVTHLLPLATILTPNIPEAKLILSHALQTGTSTDRESAAGTADEIIRVSDFERLGKQLQKLGPRWVLVKGGHLPLDKSGRVVGTNAELERFVVDVLVGPDDEVHHIRRPWQTSRSTHGTGCSLASAIASNIALGKDVATSVKQAGNYVEAGIRTAPKLGQGNGPLNHFHSLQILPFSPGYFVEYLLSRPDVKSVWDEFVHHPFVMAMGNGTLPVESFKGYIIQDYLYLIHFARANALLAYKSETMQDIKNANDIVSHIMEEIKLHIGYCQSFGISEAEVQNTEEHQACTAYTRFVLDVGMSSDAVALRMALAPCLLGYGAVAQMLHGHSDTQKEDNMFWPWIENYVADDYVAAVRKGSAELEQSMVLQSPSRIEKLIKIFVHATRMEIGFWNMFPAR